MDKNTIKSFIKNNKLLTISLLLSILMTLVTGFDGFLVSLFFTSIPLAAVYFYKFKKGYISTKYHYYILAAGLVAFVTIGITAKPIDKNDNTAIKNNLFSTESSNENTEEKVLAELRNKKIELLNTFKFLTRAEILEFTNEIKKQESLTSINNVISKAKLQNDKNKEENDPNNYYQLAKVTSIKNGSTITVKVNEKEYELKLTGLETPNNNPDKKTEFLGKEAANFTSSKLDNRNIWIEKDAIEANTHNNTIRSYVWLTLPGNPKKPTYEDVRNNTINGILLTKGFAKFNAASSNNKYSKWLYQIERDAKTAEVGLWNQSEKSSWETSNQSIAPSNARGNSSVKANGKEATKQNAVQKPQQNTERTTQQTVQKVVKQTAQPTTQEIVEETNLSSKQGWIRTTAKVTKGGKTYIADTTQGPVKGNTNSMIYHVMGQRDYNKISVNNVVWFNSEEDAIAAGYRRAKR